jgi:hypothetical protein
MFSNQNLYFKMINKIMSQRIKSITHATFLIGFIALLLLTLVVVLSRAYQATKIDVLKYLKYE